MTDTSKFYSTPLSYLSLFCATVRTFSFKSLFICKQITLCTKYRHSPQFNVLHYYF